MKADAMKIWPRSREIDFRLHRGEILGVAGLDGHGQSDFVRVLAGVQRAHSSEPIVVGERGGFHAIDSLARRRAPQGQLRLRRSQARGHIRQSQHLREHARCRCIARNRAAARLAFIDWTALGGSFEWEREKLSIKMGDRGDKITSLSGGNQQKVLIGRAFALSPNILDPQRSRARRRHRRQDRSLRASAGLRRRRASRSSICRARSRNSSASAPACWCSATAMSFEELVGDAINGERILAAMFGAAFRRMHRAAAPRRRAARATRRRRAATDRRRRQLGTRPRGASTGRDRPFILRSPAFDDRRPHSRALCRGKLGVAAAACGKARPKACAASR